MNGEDGLKWAVVFFAIVSSLAAVVQLFAGERRLRRLPRRKPAADPKEAKRRAKRENERIKLTATFFNGTGIAVLLTTAIIPIFKTFGARPEPLRGTEVVAGFAVAIGLHLFGLWLLSLWRSEE